MTEDSCNAVNLLKFDDFVRCQRKLWEWTRSLQNLNKKLRPIETDLRPTPLATNYADDDDELWKSSAAKLLMRKHHFRPQKLPS